MFLHCKFCSWSISDCCVTSYLISPGLILPCLPSSTESPFEAGEKYPDHYLRRTLYSFFYCYKWHSLFTVIKALNKGYSGPTIWTQQCFDLVQVQLLTCSYKKKKTKKVIQCLAVYFIRTLSKVDLTPFLDFLSPSKTISLLYSPKFIHN